MSWNEPGGDKKDPWSGRGQQKGPPDLDEVIRSLQEKLAGLFGGGGSSSGGSDKPGGSFKAMGFLALAALILWALTGIYIVDEGNRGVVLRFGKYVETTQPGPHWRLPRPIESHQIVNVQTYRFFELGYRSAGSRQALGSVPREALMLTRDENIVDVRLAVQYQVKDAKDFLFNVADPDVTLKEVTESAERGVIGKNTMDDVLTKGRSEVVAEIKAEVQKILDYYKAGIIVSSVNLQDAQPPEEVQGAFEDAIKAREDKQRLINEAEAYFNDVIPKARGTAAKLTQEAQAYLQTKVARAEGESNRFEQLLTEYEKAPEVTRKRLYLEAMENVLGNTDTVMVDVKGGNNLLYLPLDKLGNRFSGSPRTSSGKSGKQTTARQPATPANTRSSTRGRQPRGR